MNTTHIIGNLTRDPEMRTVNRNGQDVPVCDFNVAVNRRQRGKNEQGDADFFKVTAWRGLGESCGKYLTKGKKVYVSGPVSIDTWTKKDGTPGYQLAIAANDVEFLSPAGGSMNRNESASNGADAANAIASDGFTAVQTDELPF